MYVYAIKVSVRNGIRRELNFCAANALKHDTDDRLGVIIYKCQPECAVMFTVFTTYRCSSLVHVGLNLCLTLTVLFTKHPVKIKSSIYDYLSLLCYCLMIQCFGSQYYRDELQRKIVWLQMLVCLLVHFLVVSGVQATQGELVCFKVSCIRHC